jgi:uncharacterized protein
LQDDDINSASTVQFPQRKIKYFCQKYGFSQLSILGTIARGEARLESDVGLLIDFKPGVEVGFLLLGQMQPELSVIFIRPVDLIPESGLKPVIRDDVLGEANNLYTT